MPLLVSVRQVATEATLLVLGLDVLVAGLVHEGDLGVVVAGLVLVVVVEPVALDLGVLVYVLVDVVELAHEGVLGVLVAGLVLVVVVEPVALDLAVAAGDRAVAAATTIA